MSDANNNEPMDWPEWLLQAAPSAVEALAGIHSVHGRLRQEVAAGFSYDHILNAPINNFYKHMAEAGLMSVAAGGGFEWNPDLGELGRFPKDIQMAEVYQESAAPRMLASLSFSSKTAVVRLLTGFRESIARTDILTAFIALRSVIEQVAHFHSVLRALDLFTVSGNPAGASLDLDGIHDMLLKKAFGTRVDWAAWLTGAADDKIDRNKLKYEQGEVWVDRSADSVMGAIDALSKKLKGTRAVYELLCEFAHPNMGMQMACTEKAELWTDENGVRWVKKQLGLGVPRPFVEGPPGPVPRILQQVAQCIVLYEQLHKDGIEQEALLLHAAQVVVRDYLAAKKGFFGPYVQCPCCSGKKVRFCCGRK